jgi:glycosyltransferase involved in cell wall biosynthesis
VTAKEGRIRVVLCGPFPLDDEDLRNADGLLHSIVNLGTALTRMPELDVHVVSRSTKVLVDTETTSLGLPVTFVPDPKPAVDYLLDRRLLTGRLIRALEKVRPDIVHAHGEPQFIFAALRYRAPHVITLQSLFKDQTLPKGTKPPLKYRFAYWCLRRWEQSYLPQIRNLLAINEAITKYVRQVVPSVRVFPTTNTAAESFFAVTGTGPEPIVLSVSQISQRKGVHDLLAAFAQIAPSVPGCQLRIAGGEVQDAPYAARLREQYSKMIEAGQVVFLGGLRHEEIREELARCQVFCLASLYEASPLAVAEAMAASRPVVSTRVGDLQELVETSNSGFLVDPGDVSGLAAALKQVLNMSSEDRAAMGRRGRETALWRAHPDVAARDALSAYQTILSEAR